MALDQQRGYRSVAYFANWAIYAKKHRPQDLPAEKLTHICYAFANLRPESGEVCLSDPWSDTDIHWEGDSSEESGQNLYGCFKQLNLLKKRNRNLKILLSIGGWTYRDNFKGPASTPEGRERFAKSSVGLLKDLGLDGLDVDWEYPQNDAETVDLISLLQAVRQELDVYSRSLPEHPHFELTMAVSAASWNYIQRSEDIDPLLDFWNLMCYDYTGPESDVAGHHANLFPSQYNKASTPYAASSAVAYYTAHGVPHHKIVLGMPLYGRSFVDTDGPGHPYNGVGEGGWEAGVYDIKILPLPGSEEREDTGAVASYSYDVSRRMMVSYDTVSVARKKAEFIVQEKLGGAMWWETSSDKAGSESLIHNVVTVLGGSAGLLRQQNCVSYPHTKYDNLRRGFPNC